MIVVVLSAAPAGLRGALTRWLMEIDTGVFVGSLSARVRDQVWELVRENLNGGRALLAYSTNNEQHVAVKTIGYDRSPVDLDGMTVMMQPQSIEPRSVQLPGSVPPKSEGWSIAGRRRRYRSSVERALGSH